MQNNIHNTYIENIEKSIDYTFNDKVLILRSLTHSSYAHDNNLDYNYERLEFLGDAVVELVITEYLVKQYPSFQEGDLSILRAYIVNASTLFEISKKLDLSNNILLGKSEFNGIDNLKKAIVADIFEAVMAAVYLDGGYDNVKKIVLNLLEDFIINAVENNSFRDAKTQLQQICQRDCGALPEYTLISATGPEHNKTFNVEVDVCGKIKASGSGKSKKEAEKEAASNALQMYNSLMKDA